MADSSFMACPFFMPTEKFPEAEWPHRQRLPLGDGWRGFCTAPHHQSEVPGEHELREFCNLGYARLCSRYPHARVADAVRFAVQRDAGERIALTYVTELDYLPGEQGALEYDLVSRSWRTGHADPRVQKMAGCYLEAYLLRKRKAVTDGCRP